MYSISLLLIIIEKKKIVFEIIGYFTYTIHKMFDIEIQHTPYKIINKYAFVWMLLCDAISVLLYDKISLIIYHCSIFLS